MNENQAIIDKLKNLINISTRDYCINSKTKAKHIFITNLFPKNDLVNFIDQANSVLKYDEHGELLKLYDLQKSASNFSKETGNWPLYIARYFLTITTAKNKKIFAPLILRHVKVEKTTNYCSLYLIDDEYVINEKILTFIEREWNVDLSSHYKLDAAAPTINEYIDKLQQALSINIQILQDENEIVDNQKFYIVDNFAIGLYEPGGGKLKDDLLHIINEGVDPFTCNKIHGESFYQEAEVHDEPIFQISNNLNLYQKFAIRSALNENTVIHGPPGTGKSEVIANIIANIIINCDDALIISEKKAALDVVIDRISDLKILTLSFYDDVKNEFYENIMMIANKLGTDWLSQSFKSSSFLISDHVKLSPEYKNLKIYKQQINDFANKFVNINKTNLELNHQLYYFWNELNKFGIDKYLQFKNMTLSQMLLEKINDTVFLNNIFNLVKFVKKYNLLERNIYDNFFHYAQILKKALIDSHKDLESFFKDITKNIYQLDAILSQIPDKDEILKNLKKDNNHFYHVYEKYNSILNQYEKLIDSKYFELLKNNNIKNFLIKFNKESNQNKKLMLAEYLHSGNILEKFPLFKKRVDIDDDVIQFFNELYASEFYFLNPLIVQNIKLFLPINIISLFNYKLIDNGIVEALAKDILIDLDYDSIKSIIDSKIQIDDLNQYIELASMQKTLKINNVEINNSLFDHLLNQHQDYSLNINLILDLYIKKLKSDISNLPDELKNKVKELFRICFLKKRPSIYKMITNYFDVLKIIFPIWFTKPESASLLLPLKKDLFKYGIFDEASQMFLEKSYPLVYRVNKSIVAGDEKQLKPSSFFMSLENDDEIEYDISDTNVAESLLEKAQASLWNTFILKNHYRSQSKDLIAFSNKYFYNNELIYASINDNKKELYGLQTINVDGFFNNGVNEIEANKVIEVLQQNIDRYKKIVIITFNLAQSKYIEKLVMKLNHPLILQKLEQGLLNITNLENVQGNEGDLVIISVSYAKKDTTSKLHANFGPLINNGGSNRLNVAITRAKEKMIVIKSIDASEISNTGNENLNIFRNFIAFLDISDNQIKINQEEKLSNSFTNYLVSVVEQSHLKLKINYDVGSSIINYCILKNDNIIFCINFKKYNQYNNVLDVNIDVDETYFLNSRKYHLHLINEWEWLLSRNYVCSYLKKIFDKYIKE